jgi:hypothetical protein
VPYANSVHLVMGWEAQANGDRWMIEEVARVLTPGAGALSSIASIGMTRFATSAPHGATICGGRLCERQTVAVRKARKDATQLPWYTAVTTAGL